MRRIKHSVIATFLIALFVPMTATAEDFTVYMGKVPPFTYQDDDGVAQGAAVDIVLELMQAVGKPIERKQIKSISWARAVEDTETIPGTMLFCTARTPQREDKFKWVGPVAELNLGLVAHREPRIVIRKWEDVREYHLGVIRNSAPMQILEMSYGVEKSDMTLLANDVQQFKMLQERRVDLITQADSAAPYWIKKAGLDPVDYEMVHVIKHLKLYIAFNRQTDDVLIEKMQRVMDDLKIPNGKGQSHYDEIMERYIEGGPLAVRSQ